MKGYKVFNSDWTCRGFKFEVGSTYEEDVIPSLCNSGFHFCERAVDCFNYYSFNPDNKVAEVEALGIVANDGRNKSCTNKIHIIREIPWSELLTIVNTGKGNSGKSNSGNRNSGNWNSGDWNSGNRNSGDGNSGNRNSGDGNSGNRNSGNRNSGNRNSGNRNSGDWNSGDWNSGDGNSGCFNADEHKILLFDEPSNMTLEEWRDTDAYYLLNRIPFWPTEWIYESDMTNNEKEENPEYKTTGGYLKQNNISDCCKDWWNGLSENNRNTILSIPNFDSEKFFKITGIRV